MFTGRLRMEGGKLVHSRVVDSTKYGLFIKNLKEGDEIDVYMDIISDNGSLSQIAKVHAMIKDLATFTGNSVAGMKLLVKQEAGLCFTKDSELICKSFGDCSKDELGLAINAAQEISVKVGLNLPS